MSGSWCCDKPPYVLLKEVDLGLNTGIASADINRTETFYTLLSEQPLRDRFPNLNFDGGFNNHLINVYHDGTDWIDNNGSGVAFTPHPSDTLLAQLDYVANTVTGITGTVINDIAVNSNTGIAIAPNQYNGTNNAGEWDVTTLPTVLHRYYWDCDAYRDQFCNRISEVELVANGAETSNC